MILWSEATLIGLEWRHSVISIIACPSVGAGLTAA